MKPNDGILEDDFEMPKTARLDHFSNDVGSYEGMPQGHSPSVDESTPTSEANDEDNFDTKGSINFGMKLYNDPEKNKEGAVIAMENSDMKLYCSIPSKAGSNFFASFQGNTSFMKARGFGRTTMSFGYRVWDGISLLCDWNSMDGLTKNSFGARYQNGKSTTKTMVHYPAFNKSIIESTVLSLRNSTTIINDKISSDVELGIASNPKNITSISNLRMGFKTIHNEALPHIQIYLDYFSRLPLKLIYQHPVEVIEQSSTEISLAVGKSRFEAKALFSRTLDRFNKFSIGVGHSTWEGLTWIFRLEKGDLTLNIPIQITSSAATGYSTFSYSVSTAYLSLLSRMIHSIIGEVFDRGRTVASLEMKKEEKLLSVGKARQDAENQIMLMKKKADGNRRSEEAKGGLVIEKAMYGVEDGDCLDVMIPLQFWVIDSRLKLAATSFSGMLGFYDIRKTKQLNESLGSSTAAGDNVGLRLVALWKNLFVADTKNQEKLPFLHVRYKFNGKLFEVSTMDNEALVLPSHRSIEVK